MPDLISNAIIDDAVAQALQLSLCFLDGPGKTRHVPFSFTPCPIPAAVLAQLEVAAPLLGRLTQALAEDDQLIQDVHAALACADPFFAEMLSTHRALHSQPGDVLRVPLLLQRSDFMVDAHMGPRLVECNSIAAGMAPFGERMGSAASVSAAALALLSMRACTPLRPAPCIPTRRQPTWRARLPMPPRVSPRNWASGGHSTF